MWDFPLFPETASTVASQVDRLYFALIILGGGTATVIAALLICFAVKYRRGSRANRVQRSAGVALEASWIFLPMLAFIGIFVWSGRLYFDMRTPPADALDVYVIGRQWMWKAQHQGGRREINALHVPRGVPIRLIITSQDVIHSYYVPAFRVKMDAVPGMYTYAWFEATREGEYHLFCAEYCGAEHSLMRGHVVVMEPAAYQRWLSGEAEAEPGMPGAEVPAVTMQAGGRGVFFSAGCNACHVPESTARAPRLEALDGSEVRLSNGQIVLADEDYIRESIIRPNEKIVAGYSAPSLMPAYQDQLSPEQLNELVAYIKSIGRSQQPQVQPDDAEEDRDGR